MAAKHDQIPVTLGSTVGLGGTINVNYPAGRQQADYLGGTDFAAYRS